MQIFEPSIFTNVDIHNIIRNFTIAYPFIVLEAYMILLLLNFILKVKFCRKQKILFLTLIPIVVLINNTLFVDNISYILNTLEYPLLFLVIYKKKNKKLYTTFILLAFILLALDFLFSSTYESTNFDLYKKFNIYMLTFRVIITFMFLSFSKILNEFNINVNIGIFKKPSSQIIKHTLCLFIFNIISIFVLFYNYRIEKTTQYFSLLEFCCIFFYFTITFSYLKILNKLETTSASLKNYMLYSETLTSCQENLCNFKHDYSNTLQCIGGYIHTNNMEGLKDYYLQLLDECHRINNLTVLSPNLINNPAIYNIIASKYMKADNLNIKINLDVFMDLKNLNKEIYSIARILGILLDNAIEACSECTEKIINICFANNTSKNMYSILIENTYNPTNLNIDKIYEKGFSTKVNNTGLGLFSVKKILNKSKNLSLYTSTSNNMFSQQLEIWN